MDLRTPFSVAAVTLVLASPLAAQVLVSGDRTLSFPAGNAGRGIAIAAAGGNQTAAQSTQPVTFFVCGPCTDEKSTQTPLGIGYGSVQGQPNGSVLAQAAVASPAGSLFKVSDVYAAGARPGTFTVARSVTVATANSSDQGFNSQFTLGFVKPRDIHKYHFLAPAVWYDHNENAGPKAFASDYANGTFYWRETRSALPFVMMQDSDTGTTLSIAHTAGVPSTGIDERTKAWTVDASVQNGSLGVQKSPQLELGFIYPSDEVGAGSVKTTGGTWVRRSHPVQAGFTQGYTLLLGLGDGLDDTGAPSYSAGLRSTWRLHYAAFAPKATFVPPEIAYFNGISLAKFYSQNRNGAQGLPFGVRVDGTDERDSYQMGYTGEQIPLGFQLFRYGVLNNDTTALTDGQATLDFWAYKSGQPSGLPLTWYDVTPPKFRNSTCKFPLFIRSLSDGMEGMALAAIFARQHGMAHPAWESFAQAFGDWLVSHQNADGSFYRAYNPDGSVYANTDPDCTPGASGTIELNTTFPVRFLVELYVGTGNAKYLQSALAAGNYALTAIYGATQYVGGTTEAPASIDKEAAEQAIHAALALYDVTRDPRVADGGPAGGRLRGNLRLRVPVHGQQSPSGVQGDGPVRVQPVGHQHHLDRHPTLVRVLRLLSSFRPQRAAGPALSRLREFRPELDQVHDAAPRHGPAIWLCPRRLPGRVHGPDVPGLQRWTRLQLPELAAVADRRGTRSAAADEGHIRQLLDRRGGSAIDGPAGGREPKHLPGARQHRMGHAAESALSPSTGSRANRRRRADAPHGDGRATQSLGRLRTRAPDTGRSVYPQLQVPRPQAATDAARLRPQNHRRELRAQRSSRPLWAAIHFQGAHTCGVGGMDRER